MPIIIEEEAPVTPPFSLTFGNLKDLVYGSLKNKTALEAHSNLIGEFVNGAYQDIVRQTHSVLKKLTVSIPKSDNDLTLTDTLLFVRSFYIVDSDGHYKRLKRILYHDYLDRMNQSTQESTPEYYTWKGIKTPQDIIYIYPKPSQAFTGYVEIAHLPTKMTSDATECLLPNPLIIYYQAAVEMKRILNEPTASLEADRQRSIAKLMFEYRQEPSYSIP